MRLKNEDPHLNKLAELFVNFLTNNGLFKAYLFPWPCPERPKSMDYLMDYLVSRLALCPKDENGWLWRQVLSTLPPQCLSVCRKENNFSTFLDTYLCEEMF